MKEQNGTTTSNTRVDLTSTPGRAAPCDPSAHATDRQSERLEQARALLASGLEDVATDTDALARYLRFRSHFRDYSRQNTLLILTQRPTARYCMGYRAWQRHGRQVQRGETGIMIWAPMLRRPAAEEIAGGADPDKRVVFGFKVTYTFDYAQTEAICDDALIYESPIPKLGTSDHAELCQDLLAVAQRWDYHVTDSDGYAEGYCDWKRKVIGLRAGLSADDRTAVLAHELAHAAAHVPTGDTPRFSHAEREIQAEGAAFMAL